MPQLKPEEAAAIMNDFNEPGSLAPTGLFLGGAKYMVIQGEAGVVIRGKKVCIFMLHLLYEAAFCFYNRHQKKIDRKACCMRNNLVLCLGMCNCNRWLEFQKIL